MTGPSTQPASAPAAAERNRLGDETSPYLLQHRNNPVHWWPWGEEAFAAARAADRPIFLSVGYSTCYWCHVMERECFEIAAIAAIMNEHFVCIKVDREERPDVDDIYMMAVNVLNRGQGGWPMSVFLEPHKLQPFIAGTYFPPEDRGGRPGFPTVLTQIAGYWANQRDGVMRQADDVARRVSEMLSRAPAPRSLGRTQIDNGVTQLMAGYDTDNGGWGNQRKFPMPVNLDFLIRVAWDRPGVCAAIIHTLDRMATGGLYDQIGGGFHRYTVDELWLVPHFEKMLYDNGQLASTYAEVVARTGDPYYAEIVRETLDYVLREMTSPDGAFLSAQDAEVNHREGGNYLWTSDEVTAALNGAGLEGDVPFGLEAYGFDEGPNFRDPHHPEDGPKNVVHLVARPSVLAERMGLKLEDVDTRLRRVNTALLAVRDKRDQPITDDKILTAWNGLMIAGMADGGRVLDAPRYVDAARRAASHILGAMRSADGTGLLRTARGGHAKIDAFLEDYANMIHGLLALHRATNEDRWLDAAGALAAAARTRFRDEATGAYFDTLEGQSDLFVRVRSTYDGAVPSGNGVMLDDLVALHAATGEDAYLQDALALAAALSATLHDQPTASMKALAALASIVREYPDRLAAYGSADQTDTSPSPVAISVSTPDVRLADGRTVALEVRLTLASGFHMNSHAPGMEMLSPLDIKLVGGSGVSMDVDYPQGERFEGPVGSMLVHHGTVTLPVRLTRRGAVTDQPRLLVTYQVCTDEYCLAPRTDVVPVTITGE